MDQHLSSIAVIFGPSQSKFPTGGAGGSHVCRFRSGAWHLFAANR
jgi:hypothetical protein